jgi:hypothetical protein
MDSRDLPENYRRFIQGLEKLTRETGVYIVGCGCCDSPSLWDAEPHQLHPEAGYSVKPNGGCVSWEYFEPDMPHRWEDDQKRIVR